MNYLNDKYICKYDGTMFNLSNFDNCLFYSIPFKRKMICLNGFDDNNLNNENTDDESSNKNIESINSIIGYKNKIQFILVNKIMNNIKTQKNMKILIYFIIQVKKITKQVVKI